MYSNNIPNFQESTTILNACTKKSVNLLKAPRISHLFTSSTIRRVLVKEGLHSKVVERKPYLRQGNRKKLLEFVKEHKKWTVEQWKNVL